MPPSLHSVLGASSAHRWLACTPSARLGEKLDKRYKALCKTYHPDAEGGDKETFQKMKDEYDEIRKHLES